MKERQNSILVLDPWKFFDAKDEDELLQRDLSISEHGQASLQMKELDKKL